MLPCIGSAWVMMAAKTDAHGGAFSAGLLAQTYGESTLQK
jgi:hypothetical protein